MAPLFILFTFALFSLGTMIGSFLNVIIYRSVIGESWVRGRSKCESCRKQLKWFDNIPLLSYMMIRGKCRYCQVSLSLSHPVIEFMTGVLFVWWFWAGFVFFRLTQHPFTVIQPAFWLIVGLCLVVIFFADIRYMIIPDEAVILLTILTLLYRVGLTLFGVMQPIDFLKTILGCVLVWSFFFAIWWLTRGRGMGFGDVKFTVPFALLLGWPNVFLGTFLAFCFGALVGVGLMLLGKKTIRQAVPFGPFLVVSTLVTLVYGAQIWQWYWNLLF
jgi:leader peptidase (prepilin peptidase) / N-methyltransferase